MPAFIEHSPDPSCILLPPRKIGSIEVPLVNKILAALATRFDTTIPNIRQHTQVNSIEQWGKVRRLEGGDTMVAASVTKAQSDTRDATFVRVGASCVISNGVLTCPSSMKVWSTGMLINSIGFLTTRKKQTLVSYSTSLSFTFPQVPPSIF